MSSGSEEISYRALCFLETLVMLTPDELAELISQFQPLGEANDHAEYHRRE